MRPVRLELAMCAFEGTPLPAFLLVVRYFYRLVATSFSGQFRGLPGLFVAKMQSQNPPQNTKRPPPWHVAKIGVKSLPC